MDVVGVAGTATRAKAGARAPLAVGNLELVAATGLDVEVVGVTAVLERVVVHRRPVVGRAAQEEHGLAQRRGVGAGLNAQLRWGLGVGHGKDDAVHTVKEKGDVGATRQQGAGHAGAGRAAEVGVGAPALVADLEAVFALDACHQFIATAGPDEALRLDRIPGVEAAAQVERAAVQWVGAARHIGGPGRRRGQQAQQRRHACPSILGAVPRQSQVRLHPLTPPLVSPETIQRCAKRNTSVIGRPDNTAAAAKLPHRNFCS